MDMSMLLLMLIVPSWPPGVAFAARGELMRLDREMAGVMDCYLEAVPEIPVAGDVPGLMLGTALLRARSALGACSWTAAVMPDVETRTAMKHYLCNCGRYLSGFSDLTAAYSMTTQPDSSLASLLEDRLLDLDSAWVASGERLFGLLSEKGMQ